MKKLSSYFYDAARRAGKTAGKLNTIETVLTGDPKKIVKRIARKKTYKMTNKVARSINKFLK